eukprot:scaffold265149_cov17-Tisochrysis_lutea.AAC.1
MQARYAMLCELVSVHPLHGRGRRCEAFSETVMDLREALDRQRQAADLREEMLKQVREVRPVALSGCSELMKQARESSPPDGGDELLSCGRFQSFKGELVSDWLLGVLTF